MTPENEPHWAFEYLEFVTSSVAAFAAVVLFFVWKAYQELIKDQRADAKERAESHAKTIEALAGLSAAMVSVKDQLVDIKHQIERRHDSDRH